MFACMLFVMASGLPIAFVLGSLGVIFALFLWGPSALDLVYFAAIDVVKSFVLIAVPLFIFMGLMLQESGIADDLFDAIYVWAGRIKGALGMGTIAICALMAAMVGISGAATLSMGVIAVPAMLKRNYSKRIAIGLVQAGGALGFLIPPSVMMIMYGFIAGVSVGKLFAAGIIPGLMLASMYIIYIGIRCYAQPQMGPALPSEERATLKQKLRMTKVLVLPAILVVVVLGFIFLGITSPTEASAVGALGAVVCAAIKRKLTWDRLQKAALRTVELCGFSFWIVLGAIVFSKVYTGLGAAGVIRDTISNLEISPWGVLLVMQLSFFLLGMFLDDIAILFMCMPIYIPIISYLGFDQVWFAILYILNMQMAYLTPPYGVNLFYMKAVAPPEVTLGDIYISIIPFVCLQALCLLIIMVFPGIVLFLPNLIFSR
ncbi:MAG: TRAP transporter large permease subunit [Deltaproteobacteria bacterium]|nr:TRAP transporter large permease subunit [Deltaproteobacteria bacterium]